MTRDHAALERFRRALDARPDPLLLWWRDDDAGPIAAKTDRLLALIDAHDAPATIAVVPASLEPPTARALAASDRVAISQHGWSHQNHAGAGEKKIELGGGADRARLERDLARGRALLEDAFGPSAVSMLTPPWNRIAPDVEAMVCDLGFTALSIFGRHGVAPSPSGLLRLDTHVDAMTWTEGPRWIGLDALVDGLLAAHDRSPRAPVGLLTHHLVMDDAAFAALDALLAASRSHPKLRMLRRDAALERRD